MSRFAQILNNQWNTYRLLTSSFPILAKRELNGNDTPQIKKREVFRLSTLLIMVMEKP